jgi:hypothetical protein
MELPSWGGKSRHDGLTALPLLFILCTTLVYSGCAGLTSSATKGPINTPPTVLITSPASGGNVSGTITVSANATDSVALTSVQFQVDGNNDASKRQSFAYSGSHRYQ